MEKIKRITVVLVFLVIACNGFTQQKPVSRAEQFEKLFSYWFKGLEQARKNIGISTAEYMVFQRFYESKVDSVRAGFMKKIGNGTIDSSNVQMALQSLVNNITIIYSQFAEVEKEYPSSVDEYRRHIITGLPAGCDTNGCTNIGFEQGTLNGWNAYYGYNDNPGSSSFFNVTNVTGGPVGAVTQAANDVLTSTAGYYNTGLGPNPSPDYMVSITSGTRGDALVPTVPVVSPFGGSYSVMLGDSTQKNYGVAILSKTFLVSAANADFTYQYSVFLENPISHSFYEQPFFQVALLDQNGDTIPFCGQYQVVSSLGDSQGFSKVYVPPIGTVGNDTAYYKDWTVVSVPLKKYIGQCVTIVFESGDCSLGGHFGYAYVDASCAPLQIITSSPAICGQNYITLTGPPGFTSYQWSSNTGLNMKGDSTQVIKVDSAGTYQLIVTPVTGKACADTLFITVGKLPGPVPVPDFKNDTLCSGMNTTFVNISNPVAGPNVKFYWDFTGLGTFQDSTADPQWTFNAPGTYSVTLYEVINGCGADTTLNVVVVPPPVPSIVSPASVCEGTLTLLTAYGGGSYAWSNGSSDQSILINPTPADTSFYVVVTKGCSDTAFAKVNVLPTKPVKACCDTTIYYGEGAPITAVGPPGNYFWTPANTVACSTCTSTVATPSVETVYSVYTIDSNGCKSRDSVTIYIEQCGNAWIPNAFTPNHDKLNDYFAPVGDCIYYYTMYIFDRWGSLIYKTENSQPWDGTVNGHKVQEDTYVYKMIITTTDYAVRTYIGNVTVIR